MGYYINPTDMTKEEFLEKHGTKITRAEALDCNYNGDKWPICLVRNPEFSAAGICDTREEAIAFSQPDDYRPKQWYLVPRELLKAYCNIA